MSLLRVEKLDLDDIALVETDDQLLAIPSVRGAVNYTSDHRSCSGGGGCACSGGGTGGLSYPCDVNCVGPRP